MLRVLADAHPEPRENREWERKQVLAIEAEAAASAPTPTEPLRCDYVCWFKKGHSGPHLMTGDDPTAIPDQHEMEHAMERAFWPNANTDQRDGFMRGWKARGLATIRAIEARESAATLDVERLAVCLFRHRLYSRSADYACNCGEWQWRGPYGMGPESFAGHFAAEYARLAAEPSAEPEVK
jgi:hypothetical protein